MAEPEIIHRWTCTRCGGTHEDHNPQEKREGYPPGWWAVGLKGVSHLLCGGCLSALARFLERQPEEGASDG